MGVTCSISRRSFRLEPMRQAITKIIKQAENKINTSGINDYILTYTKPYHDYFLHKLSDILQIFLDFGLDILSITVSNDQSMRKDNKYRVIICHWQVKISNLKLIFTFSIFMCDTKVALW